MLAKLLDTFTHSLSLSKTHRHTARICRHEHEQLPLTLYPLLPTTTTSTKTTTTYCLHSLNTRLLTLCFDTIRVTVCATERERVKASVWPTRIPHTTYISRMKHFTLFSCNYSKKIQYTLSLEDSFYLYQLPLSISLSLSLSFSFMLTLFLLPLYLFFTPSLSLFHTHALSFYTPSLSLFHTHTISLNTPSLSLYHTHTLSLSLSLYAPSLSLCSLSLPLCHTHSHMSNECSITHRFDALHQRLAAREAAPPFFPHQKFRDPFYSDSVCASRSFVRLSILQEID